ncbi:uncharacterized protein LOC131051199 isoform X2 [Cryptomeria japonica]|uniref:uncharacterized protein LOC131051199 isoform X2 n=1 Tax=Cryptomeria japonica TaxID=3369 RepID=UPI0027DA951E|nr:uncharacterized protein LOC131051199 isoform X2 [Cryptomeria japonica]
MEKNREVRRGGVVGKRHVSAARRSRVSSGFKYSSANEDGDDTIGNNPSTSPRLQDSRSKKLAGRMSPSLQEDDSCKDLDRSQNKRKRPGLQEPLNHLSTSSAAAMDDNSDDTEMGRSEDDDDLPPPTVQRRPWKLKLHGKPREDLSPIDPAAVPRKLRTAMTKRQQESTSHMHVADISKQHLQNDATTMSTPFSTNAAVTPSRKKKPDNLKPPTAKLAKTSSTKVSKAEVEVAETLYDLARMFAAETVPYCPEKKAEPLLSAKSGSASSSTEPDRKRSPGTATADVASPSSSLAQSQQGVLKKKRPRMSLETKDEELTSVTDPCSSAGQALCLDSEKSQSQMETKTSPKGGALVSPVIGLMAASTSVKVKMENPVVHEAKIMITEGNNNPPSMDIQRTTEPSEKLTILNSAVPVNVPNTGAELTENLDKREAQKPELEYRQLELAPKDGGSVNKFEIDLMAPPQGIDRVYEFIDSNMPDVKEKEQALPDYHKSDDNMNSKINNGTEKNECQVDMATIPSAEVALADKERKQVENSKNIELDKEFKQPIGSPAHHKCNDWTTEKDNGIIKERNNKTDALKDRVKQEVIQQTLNGTGINVKQDAVIHKSDSNALAKCTTTSNLKGMPAPASVASWPAGFPHLGYYSTVAAVTAVTAAAAASTWPATPSVTGTSSSENSRVTPQLPSFPFPPQQSRKRCATHVYISNFIDSQQHMKPNSLWALAYGNPTVLYGKGIMGTQVSNTLEPGSVGSLKEKEPIGAAAATTTVNGAKEKNEPAFGLPVTVSTAASVSSSGTGTANVAVSNILVTAAMVSGGSSASTCSSSVSGIGNGLLDGSVASAAVLQAQLLNSVIQQPTFPFPISTDPFGSAYGHLVPQQVSHVFSKHPFYDTHMVSQQLANTTSPSAPQKQPKNSQGSFSSGSSQLQYQEALTSSQATLSLSGAASHQPKHLNEKNNTADNRSGKKQMPVVQRNIYNQHFTTLNSQPAALTGCTAALPIISQDFSLVTNFGGKQTGKMKQQAQAQPLPPQQVTGQIQKQQKAYLLPQYHMTASGLQTDLNEFDSRVSQLPLNRGSIGPDLVGLPGVASIMTSQGELLQNMPDFARGHAQSQNSIQNQTSSGQLHQYSTHVYHDQKMHQRQHALMERVGTANTAETVRTTNEGIYGKFGREENLKESIKCELDQPNVLRFEWDSSRNMSGSQTNTDPKRASTVNSNMITFSEGTAGKLSTRQGIHIPSQNVSLGSQGLRHGHLMQDSGQLKTTHVASSGSLLAAASSTPPQAMQGVTSKLQGQQSRSEQPAMNSVSVRISTAPSISSSASTTSPLPSLHLVPKSGLGAPTKNAMSVKDSHSSQQKSPMTSTSAKGVSAANMVSVLVPGQNHYSIQQQHQQHTRHPQPVLQNYQQSNKHPSTQQQHLQFGQHIVIHPPYQYDARTQSQVHSQPMSQQSTLHHQQTLQQLQQSPGQTTSLTQQHLKHLQPVLTMPYGVSAIGNLPHNTGAVDSGNASRSIVSDGGKTTAKSTGDTSSKTSCNDRSTHSHNHNSAVSSLQHVSSSNTVPVPYPNSLSQPMPNTVAVEKLSQKTNQ